jgi:two-component system, chemotaxis family, chemotaxis protein CheY
MSARDILVVEDDAGIRQTIAECLELEGYAVRQAASGVAALDALDRGGLPLLVLLDVVMPGLNGQELLARLRAEPETAGLPVVVMTAAVPSLTGPIEGASALLPKPFNLSELLAVTLRFCGPPSVQGGAAI